MSIIEITREGFDSLGIERIAFFPERAWFKSTELDIAGTVIRDPVDHDWSYVLLAKDSDGVYRYIEGEVSLQSELEARGRLLASGARVESEGEAQEKLYASPDSFDDRESSRIVSSIDDEIKRYLKKHPEKMYELDSRKFEELVASILKDLGFEVELTQATRDGGRDIIASIRNTVCSYLTYVECKRYASHNKVGVGVVREVVGVHHIRKATKSIIVTTSSFTRDAQREAAILTNQIELKDFTDLKTWLQRY